MRNYSYSEKLVLTSRICSSFVSTRNEHCVEVGRKPYIPNKARQHVQRNCLFNPSRLFVKSQGVPRLSGKHIGQRSKYEVKYTTRSKIVSLQTITYRRYSIHLNTIIQCSRSFTNDYICQQCKGYLLVYILIYITCVQKVNDYVLICCFSVISLLVFITNRGLINIRITSQRRCREC